MKFILSEGLINSLIYNALRLTKILINSVVHKVDWNKLIFKLLVLIKMLIKDSKIDI